MCAYRFVCSCVCAWCVLSCVVKLGLDARGCPKGQLTFLLGGLSLTLFARPHWTTCAQQSLHQGGQKIFAEPESGSRGAFHACWLTGHKCARVCLCVRVCCMFSPGPRWWVLYSTKAMERSVKIQRGSELMVVYGHLCVGIIIEALTASCWSFKPLLEEEHRKAVGDWEIRCFSLESLRIPQDRSR